jgi:hypothetical protein
LGIVSVEEELAQQLNYDIIDGFVDGKAKKVHF